MATLRVITAAAMAAVLALASPGAAKADSPPPHFKLTASQAVRIAERSHEGKRPHAGPGTHWVARTAGPGRWFVKLERGQRPLTLVMIEDRTGDVLEPGPFDWVTTDNHVSPLEHQIEIAFAVLGLAFLVPFFDRRRPFRLLHLDLLVVLSFGISMALYHRGRVLLSVPLVYPPLAYLMARALMIGLGKASPAGKLVPSGRYTWLGVGLAALLAARYGFDLLAGRTSDVSYASVFGAANIREGYDAYVSSDANHLDTYGPIAYVAYLPFELIWPLSKGLSHDYLAAARAAAISFDALTALGLFLVGRRLRPGRDGKRLGIALAYAWAACPLTLPVLAVNTNDGLLAMLLVYSFLALASPRGRGLLLGLATAAKFAPLMLAPLFAAGTGRLRLRGAASFSLVFAAALLVPIAAYLPDGGIREFYDSTLGWQFKRHSFFSIWSQYPQLEPLRLAIELGVAGLAGAVAFVPKPRGAVQVAALGTAVLIGLQLTVIHWFPVYVTWFLPFLLVALFGGVRSAEEASAPAAAEREREPVPA